MTVKQVRHRWRGWTDSGTSGSTSLTWTNHHNALEKKAHQHLYQQRASCRAGLSPGWGAAPIRTPWPSGEWFAQLSASTLPNLQDIYTKHSRTRAIKIISESTHPGNKPFVSLLSGRRYHCLKANTERMRRGFFSQAIHILNKL